MSCSKCGATVPPAFATEWKVCPPMGWTKSELTEGPANPLSTIALEICENCLRKGNRTITIVLFVILSICLVSTVLGIFVQQPIVWIAGGIVMVGVGIGLIAHLFSQRKPQSGIRFLVGDAIGRAQITVGTKKNFFIWNPIRGMGFVAAGTNNANSLEGLSLSGLEYGEHVVDILPLTPWTNSAVLTDRYIRSNLDTKLGEPCSLNRIIAPFILRMGKSGIKTLGVLYQPKERPATTVGWTSDSSPDCVGSFFSNLTSLLGWSIYSMQVKETPENIVVLLSDKSCVVTAPFINPKWPKMCCVCENPSIFKTRPFYMEEHGVDPMFKGVGTLQIEVPYCETCHEKVEKGSLPGVAILHKIFGSAAVYFQNKNYAISFLRVNGLPLPPSSVS